jgi:glycogen(starch) synthase
MKIALVSFEFPPFSVVGGIGTYFFQTAQMLVKNGVCVEVFTSHREEKLTSEMESSVLVHRLGTNDIDIFRKKVLALFEERHQEVGFDFIEGPEYGADTLFILNKYPGLPSHIKLHTPSFLIRRISAGNLSVLAKTKYIMGALLRFKKPDIFWNENFKEDIEYQNLLNAHVISSPSKDLKSKVVKYWHIKKHKINIVPYCYSPKKALLEIPVGTPNEKLIITFIGRLEKRKGVHLLINVIPEIIKKHPKVVFKFIGRSQSSPDPTMDMKNYLISHLINHLRNIEFIEEQTQEQLTAHLSSTSVCIFPSIWENFPNVCLEAMAAARCIIGSKNGGMAEMLADGAGVLISPEKPKEIIRRLNDLLANPEKRLRYGAKGRRKVLSDYNEEVIFKNYIALTNSTLAKKTD